VPLGTMNGTGTLAGIGVLLVVAVPPQILVIQLLQEAGILRDARLQPEVCLAAELSAALKAILLITSLLPQRETQPTLAI